MFSCWKGGRCVWHCSKLLSCACWLSQIVQGLMGEEFVLLSLQEVVIGRDMAWFMLLKDHSVCRTDCRGAGRAAGKSFRMYCCGPGQRSTATWTRAGALEVLKRGWICDGYMIAPKQEMCWFIAFFT